MDLNEEQLKAAHHPEGEAALLLAGAGSGKTATLTERISWLIEQGVQPRRILAITFTNKAANEIRERVLKRTGLAEDDAPRLSTIHSLALSLIRRNPQGFGLGSKISPLDDYDQSELMKKIVAREHSEANPWDLLEHIQFHRARGVGFACDYTDAVHEKAKWEHAGYHALGKHDVDLWALYEKEKMANSTLDFDDMLWIVLRRMKQDPEWLAKLQNVFAHVLLDEAQDTNVPQFEVITSLLGPNNRNLYVVGDTAQCQPPGTMVTYASKPARHIGRGMTKAEFAQRPIEALVDDDAVTSWTKLDQRSYAAPRKIRVAHRYYSGPMLTIQGANGCSTRVTPNHWLWVRFNRNTSGKYLLYLMFREGLGYRIGISKFKTREFSSSGFGLSGRLNCERGHKAWILRVFDTRQEAEAWEEIYSLKYGIPESVFNAAHACRNKTHDLIELIFSYANPAGAEQCLTDHGLFVNAPLVERTDDATVNNCNRKWRGYFKTVAANVVAIAGLLDIPIQGVNRSTAIIEVTTAPYEGLVYSLDVEKDHTYIADGLVVGNSIYAFNGAAPYLIKQYGESWRGGPPTLYKLLRNHRSVPEIVNFANAIRDNMQDVESLRMESFRGMNGERGTTKLLYADTPVDISRRIANQINESGDPLKNFAILVRSSSQIRDIEGELVRARIPYVVRGGRSLLQTEEVRDVLSYLRFAVNTCDFAAMSRATSAPKQGIGNVALENVRKLANANFKGDLLLACAASGGKFTTFATLIRAVQGALSDPVRALDLAMSLASYPEYIRRKYGKEPDKVETKIENLRRLRMMIEGFAASAEMSTEDLVFQLTMERADKDDERGVVTISTIHSAKGLEWPVVFVYSVVETQLPHWRSCGSAAEVDEERRLWYVAVTRARERCVICVPTRIQRGSGMSYIEPSRFLTELGIECEG